MPQSQNSSNISDPLQVYDGDGNFILDRKLFTEAIAGADETRICQVLVHIGTFLNAAFGTKFQVNEDEEALRRTTVGVHVAFDRTACLAILDVEGSDGIEAGDSRIVENIFHIFSLVLCSTIVINIDEKQVSSINGSGKGLLRSIMETYLTILGSNPPESLKIRMIFALRDSYHKRNGALLKQQLERNVEDVWKEVAKPAYFQNQSYKDFFTVEVERFSNKLEHEVDFTETARKFGARIRGEPEKGDTLEPTFHKNVPLQELYEIMERTLVAVAQNEPVDAPSLYLLLSRSKCHEISVQSLDKVKQRIEMEVGVDMDPKKFKQVMDSIYNSQLELNDRFSKPYAVKARDQEREILVTSSRDFILSQYAQFISNHGKRLEKSLEMAIAGIPDADASTWWTIVSAKREKMIEEFRQMAIDSLPLGADVTIPAKMGDRFRVDLELTIAEPRRSITKQTIESESVLIAARIKSLVCENLKKVNPRMWKDTLQEFTQQVTEAQKRLQTQLLGIGVSDEDMVKEISQLTSKPWEAFIKGAQECLTETSVLAVMKEIHQNSIENQVWTHTTNVGSVLKQSSRIAFRYLSIISSAPHLDFESFALSSSISRTMRLELQKLVPPAFIKDRFIEFLDEERLQASEKVQLDIKQKEAEAEKEVQDSRRRAAETEAMTTALQFGMAALKGVAEVIVFVHKLDKIL